MQRNDIQIVSVNRGQAATINAGGNSIVTGSFKRPIAGPVDVNVQGLVGDLIGDKSRHGGPDQAIYIYSADDASWWAEQLQCEIRPGHFGENLTINHWWPNVSIGDRIQIGELILEVTFPRIPCGTLAARMGDAHFLKAFIAARKPGVYARVIAPGSVAAGQPLAVSQAHPACPLTDELFDLWHDATLRNKVALQRALDAPIASRARPAFLKWLASTHENQQSS